MTEPNKFKTNRLARSGFTLVQLLIASSMTAIVAGASATLISAGADASAGTADLRKTKSQGFYALERVLSTVRAARAIGTVTTSAFTYWDTDADADDKLDLYETGIVSYDSANKQIVLKNLKASGATPTTLVTTADFTNATTLAADMPVADTQTYILCDNVSSCTFTAYPGGTATRIIYINFTIGSGVAAYTFQGSADLRAPGDYLFNTQTQAAPPMGSTRKQRAAYSRWSGFADLGTLTTVTTVN